MTTSRLWDITYESNVGTTMLTYIPSQQQICVIAETLEAALLKIQKENVQVFGKLVSATSKFVSFIS